MNVLYGIAGELSYDRGSGDWIEVAKFAFQCCRPPVVAVCLILLAFATTTTTPAAATRIRVAASIRRDRLMVRSSAGGTSSGISPSQSLILTELSRLLPRLCAGPRAGTQ